MQRNFKKFAKFAVLCGLAVGIMVHPAFATDAPVRTTEKVIVTAGRIAEKAKSVTQNVTVLDEEFIQKNQHKSLDQVLMQQGIQITGYATDTSANMTVALRGMKSTSDDANQGHVMILINGQRSSLISLNMIPMVSIERVEVLRGPAAVQYGSMAFGGVVNIITKRGTEQTQAAIEIGGGSWESWKGMAGASGMVGNVDFAFGFSHSLRNGNWEDGDGNKIDNTEIGGQTTYYANVGYTFANEHRIGLTFMGANFDRMGDWGGKYRSNEYSANFYEKNGADKLSYDDRKNYAISLSYEGGLKEYGLSWLAKYSHSEDYNAVTPDPSDKWDNWYRMDTEIDNAVAQLSWKYDFLTLTGGVEYTKTESNKQYGSKSYIPWDPVTWNPLPEKVQDAYTTPYELNNISTFLLAKTAFLNDMLVFSVGARYDDYTFKSANDRSEDNFSLNAGAAFSPWDWLTFRANVGEAFRMPTGMEVHGYKGSAYPIIENNNLEAEEGLGWDFGFEVAHKGFKAGLTYFAMDYENKIYSVSVGGNNYQYINLPGTTKFRGLEGNISYDLGQTFGWDFMIRPYANFTHMMKYDNESGKELNEVRDWVAGFGVNYSHPSIGLDVDLSCTYLGEQNVGWDYGAGVKEHGDNYIVDLSIMKSLYETEDMGKFSAKLDLRNLTDEYYEPVFGYPCPGRSFFLSLIWNY